jgi:hypothetical protein
MQTDTLYKEEVESDEGDSHQYPRSIFLLGLQYGTAKFQKEVAAWGLARTVFLSWHLKTKCYTAMVVAQ